MRTRLLPSTLLAVLLPTINAITLSDFQPINGFSTQCTQSYNTPLQDCTQSDFQNGHACSSSCIAFLEALTKMLNTDCKGTSAFPNTLIGLFFSQQGTSTLCPNVLGSSGSGGGDQASYASAASPGGASTSAISPQQSSGVIASTTSASSTSSSLAALVSSSSSEKPTNSHLNPLSTDATSSTIVVAQTTVTPSSTPPNYTPVAATRSSLHSSSSSSTSSASQTSSTGKDTNGGGGTILDVGSTGTAPLRLQVDTRSWALLGGSAVLAWLF